MPLKINDKDIKACKGNNNIKSVMIGTKCVYGYDINNLNIFYPSREKGRGFYVTVNESKVLNNPTTKGALKVRYGDKIVIRTYAEEGFMNPNSTVTMGKKTLGGKNFEIITGGISVSRATTYSFVIKGDINITLATPVPAPKARIYIHMDDNVHNVSFRYFKGPYEYDGVRDFALNKDPNTISTTENMIDLLFYNEIISNSYEENPRWMAKEGYKISSKTHIAFGLLKEKEQGTISAVSEVGTRVSIVCPTAPIGLNEYYLNVIASEFSRETKTHESFFNQISDLQQQTPTTLWLRHGEKFSFYKGDTIRITAKRKNGYKLPTLGKIGDISLFARSKDIVLTDENILFFEGGEPGIPISLVNNSLSTTEHVYFDVNSEYADTVIKARNPQMYVGDKISIPLSHEYRIGTNTHRKPGVGIRGDGIVLIDITFASNIMLTVPTVKVLTIALRQGAERVETYQQSLGTIAEFHRTTNLSTMQISYNDIRYRTITPIIEYGTEDFFLKTFNMTYSCKRYLMDVGTDEFINITQTNVQPSFSYFYDRTVLNLPVIKGAYTLDADGKGIKLEISKYDTDWVANWSNKAKLIVNTIIV